MDWLLSPTNYMIELVPAKQNGSNGSILEVILITDFVMMIHYCRQIESRLYDHLLFMFGADNDTESSCRHSHESSSITEVGFHASCRWSLQSWNLIIWKHLLFGLKFYHLICKPSMVDRKHWIPWSITSSGMQKLAAGQKGEAEVQAKVRDGGFLHPMYLQLVSLTMKEQGCWIRVNWSIKYSKLLRPLMKAYC